MGNRKNTGGNGAYESIYSSFIKNEMRKINVNSGCCENGRITADCSGDLTFEEEIGIIRAIERERDSSITITDAAENTAETLNIQNDFCRGGRGFLRCLFCGRRRRRDRGVTDENIIIEIKNGEFIDPTNYYRFVNQNFCNNMTGKSNIDITNLDNNTLEKRIQIEKILKKYGRDK